MSLMQRSSLSCLLSSSVINLFSLHTSHVIKMWGYKLSRMPKNCTDRRGNLLIRGITDDDRDDDKSCMRLVKDCLRQKLKLVNDKSESVLLVRCHRIGKTSQYMKRQMIVRFQYFADRQLIWDNRYQLKMLILRSQH